MAEKEYIERDHIVKFIENGLNNPDKVKAFGHDAAEILAEIHLAPTADVAPVVHGKWKLHDNGDGTCDQCGFRQKHIWDYDNWQNYCGVCGADMRGGKHGN